MSLEFVILVEVMNMKARMKNPAMILPGAMEALLALNSATQKGGVPQETLELIHLRVSQINGCSVCVDMQAGGLTKSEETAQRFFVVAAWRDAPFFTDAERAALALAGGGTRPSDRSGAVPQYILAH